jgi:hypothetical protein
MNTTIPQGATYDGQLAELAARRTTAAAVLADYRTALASAPLANPPGREWMLRLADTLGMLLDGLAVEDAPQGHEGAAVHGLSCGCPDCDNDEDEPFCWTCGARVGIFIGHGEAWLHYRGEGTAADPVELYDAGHVPDVGWRPAGAR